MASGNASRRGDPPRRPAARRKGPSDRSSTEEGEQASMPCSYSTWIRLAMPPASPSRTISAGGHLCALDAFAVDHQPRRGMS